MLLVTPSPIFSSSMRMPSVMHRLGLRNGLQACLDARDIRSYPGTGQIWSSYVNGLGMTPPSANFHLGANDDGGGDAADPTFVGTENDIAAYFSLDSDYFTLAGANPAWVNQFHKAGAMGSIGLWWYATEFASGRNLIGTSAGNSIGWRLNRITGSGRITFGAGNGSAGVIDTGNGNQPGNSSNDVWNFTAFSINEAGGPGASIKYQNGTVLANFDATMTSPSGSDAAGPLEIGRAASGVVVSGFRIRVVIISTAFFTANDWDRVFRATRRAFGV